MILLNRFEGGVKNVALSATNTGGDSGDTFTFINIGASATLIFDDAQAAHGTLSCKVATPAGAVASRYGWVAPYGFATSYGRMYLYFAANPSAAPKLWWAQDAISGAARASVHISNTGKLFMQDASSVTIAGSTLTNAIALNQWVRVEWKCVHSATVGSIVLKLFNTADSTTATETKSVGSLNLGTLPASFRWGVTAALANIAAFWMDEVAMSDTDYVGPYFPPAAKILTPPGITSGSKLRMKVR